MEGCWAEHGFQCFRLGITGTPFVSYAFFFFFKKKSHQKKKQQTLSTYTLQAQPTEYFMFYIEYILCSTRPLSCERPFHISKLKTACFFIHSMFNVKLPKLPRSVKTPDPPKANVIQVPISINLQGSPTLNLQPHLHFDYTRKPAQWKSVMLVWQIYSAWATAARHAAPLEECWLFSAWARATRLWGRNKDALTIAKLNLLLLN